MKVLKFGGTSVATPERINSVIGILERYYKTGEQFAVVFSAFGGVTNALVEMSDRAAAADESYVELFEFFRTRHVGAAKKLLNKDRLKVALPELDENHEDLKNLLSGIFLVREVSPRTRDYVLSFGERNAAFIISQAMRSRGITARYLDARKVIRTDRNFGAANVVHKKTNANIKEYFEENPEIQVITGFIGSAKSRLTTTLGRGGSDYTAALFAAALNAKMIEIWTDVDGVLTADPRKVKKAFTLQKLTYAEAMEMSHFGAKVIYPPTIQPALAKKIPIVIRNTFNPDFSGTYISEEQDPGGKAVKGISSISNISLLTIQGSGLFGVPGTAARLFGALAQKDINVILITQASSEHSITFAVNPDQAKQAKTCVENVFEHEINTGSVDPIKRENDLSVVAVIERKYALSAWHFGQVISGTRQKWHKCNCHRTRFFRIKCFSSYQ